MRGLGLSSIMQHLPTHHVERQAMDGFLESLGNGPGRLVQSPIRRHALTSQAGRRHLFLHGMDTYAEFQLRLLAH